MLNIKSSHKAIKEYYSSLEMHAKQGMSHETAIKNAFQNVLVSCCKQMNYDFIEEYPFKRLERYKARIDGAFLDSFRVPQGFWEAKDSQDDLAKEVVKKFEIGYPRDNIIFQSPERAIIYQGSTKILDENISSPERLVSVLKCLFEYKTDTQMEWEKAVDEFKQRIPESAEIVVKLIEEERKSNQAFIKSFDTFTEICRTSINPNISIDAIEEMLVQHLLTERIFRKVFENPDFINRNIIASEIDNVITALTSRKFNRNDFLKPLDRFYTVLEKQAHAIDDYSIKQTFLNTVYEKFFQGFAIKNADTMGIVYTPQPIVDFMVNSVDEILKKEFGRSLSAKNVNILDPFTGTGNFITNIMRKINKMDLKYKYMNELHCNEIMLLPYYIASMNIEHQFYEITGEYIPFPGICLVDTFQLVESSQFAMFSEENTQRVEQLKQTPIFVYIGNPPYNAGQANENDNNKNRKYPILDKRVSDTFAKDSKATLKNSLADPYVKAFRMAIDKVIENGEGIVTYVTNNSFIDGIAMDGMRKHIEENFDKIYIYNLKGNVRQNTKIYGTTHNVFGIQVGVSINILVKFKNQTQSKCSINYLDVDDFLRKEDRYKLLENAKNVYGVEWNEVIPDKNYVWLNKGMQDDWDSLLLMGNKESKVGNKVAIFKLYSNGISSSRDSWVYNRSSKMLENNIEKFHNNYNYELYRLKNKVTINNIDDLVNNDDSFIKWSDRLKDALLKNKELIFDKRKIQKAIYRPFYNQYVYFDDLLIHRRYQQHKIFPIYSNKLNNFCICITSIGNSKPFQILMVDVLPDVHLTGDSQCFPFYTYDEDGTNRKDNISDWSLNEFMNHYKDENITKWNVFYYIYGVLHKPEYREKYAANLRRELPRIPFYDDFWKYSEAGKKLADLHVNYESQPEYYLDKIEAPGKKLNYLVEKMKYNKDKTAIIYNDFLTLSGIPVETFDYKLGNRSALDWIIDQYQIKTDKRSGIINDPNRLDEQDYIITLIGKIITVSLETVKIVNGLRDTEGELSKVVEGEGL